jgi:hypothetical protein
MLTKHFALVLFGAALVTPPALAQTNPPATPNAAASSQAMPSGNWMTEEKPGQWRASKLEGLDVYNNDEKIGDIRELLVGDNGRVEAVVIGVGGFLGLGEHDVAVPFQEIKFVMEPRPVNTAATNPPGAANPPATPAPTAPATTGTVPTPDASRKSAPDHALLNRTKDQLKAAPEFKYAR